LSVTRCGRLTAKAMTSAMSRGGMDQSRASLETRLLAAWVMWSGSSVAVAPGSMTMTRTSGCSSTRSASDQPLIPHLVAA
jgi:hypothetical protein